MILFTVFLIIATLVTLIGSVLLESKKARFLALIPMAILALGLFVGSIHIIDSTSIGVVKHFGVIDGVATEGWNFTNPWTTHVEKYDLRVHVRETSFASYTKDAQPVDAAVEYQFKLDPAFVTAIAKEYGSQEILESKIGNLVEEKVKVVFSRYSGMSLLENRAKLSTEIDASVSDLEEMFHVSFTSIVVKDIDFSDAFESAVEAKMEAEQDALRAEQDKKKAITKAEEVREVAAIEAEAAIAQAKGEAEALRITKEALDKMPESWIQQQYLEKWNGVLPQIVTEGSGLMLTPELSEKKG